MKDRKIVGQCKGSKIEEEDGSGSIRIGTDEV